MAYPLPTEGSCREQLYQEAMFFYEQYEQMKTRAIESETEVLEQCRLNGMGASREAALITRAEKVDAENARLLKRLEEAEDLAKAAHLLAGEMTQRTGLLDATPRLNAALAAFRASGGDAE